MFAEVRRKVADALKRRGVHDIVYFHCDHFEPWRGQWGDVAEKNANDILNFCRTVEGIDYARKLTLFYKCNNYICWDMDRQQRRAPGDEIGFAIATEREIEVARVAMSHIAHHTGHEIQVHFHHEFFTGNDKYCLSSPTARRFFQERNTPELDGKRFDTSLSLALETIRAEAEIPLEQWFFVHGNWALNGSDRDVCTIADEMQRLQNLGCLGDFTFPAGRGHCDPKYAEPIFVRPVTGLKSYDFPEAEAVPAYGNREGPAQNRFFIWSSILKANASSIDYYSPDVRKRCENIPGWLDEIVEKAVVKDGTLFFKTHSHSMYSDYFESARRPIPPHLYPGVQNLLCTLFDAAAEADIDIRFETASEVYRRFVDPASIGTAKPSALSRAQQNGHGLEPRTVEIGDAAEHVNAIALDVMRERLQTFGSQGAGTYAYYDAMIGASRLVQPLELQIARYLIDILSPSQPVVEMRCGLGLLSLTMAVAGRQTYGVESDEHRIQSHLAIRTAIERQYAGAKARSNVIRGLFPNELPADIPRGAALVFMDTVSGLEIEKQRAILTGVAEFSFVLFDAQRFFTKRESGADIDQLLQMFVDAGMSRPVLVFDLADNGQYYLGAGKRAE
jgi:hypothetical protein